MTYSYVPSDSSVDRAPTFGAGGRGFESWPHHTKGVKNGTSEQLLLLLAAIWPKYRSGNWALRYNFIVKTLRYIC